MRKLLLALLLFAVLLLSSCAANQQTVGVEEKDPPPAKTNSQPDNQITEKQDEVNYVFVSNLVVGYYKDGTWKDAAETPIFVADLLKQKNYYGYNQEALMGKSAKLTFSYVDDLGYSFASDGELLIPYADENDEENKTISFNLPAELPEAVNHVELEGYNWDVEFNINFPADNDTHTIPLVITAGHDPRPGVIDKIEGPFLKEDIEAVKAELQKLGVPGAIPNITEGYAYDLNGDGYKERIIFANTPLTETRYPYVSQEELDSDNSGYYYMTLCENESGYTTITSWCYPYNFGEKNIDTSDLPGEFYSDAIKRIYLEGIFDINGDGIFELCLYEPGYEWGSVFVFCVDEGGHWEKIMSGKYGM